MEVVKILEMAGHNRWSQIKRKKAAQDARRSQIFSRIIRDIYVAVREGGPDPETNPKLRMVIANAKAVNMPKENIERAIQKAAGAGAEAFQEVIYEAFAPHGVALIIECTTDNVNRTLSNVRYILSKNGGSLATRGAVMHMFEQKGVFTIEVPEGKDPEEFALELADYESVEDVVPEEGTVTVYTRREDFGNFQEVVESKGYKVVNASLQYVPMVTTSLDVEKAKAVINLIQKLEDDPDVRAVHHNLEWSEEYAELVS